MRPDLSHYWMPFTDNRRFKAAPRLISSASGIHYFDHQGRPLIDAASGLWCVNAGHSRPAIAEAIARQATTLDYAPSFRLGHPLAFALAGRLAEALPGDLDHLFFTNSGSEAVDTSIKIARRWHQARGDSDRTVIIGRERAYHGVGFGGMSVGGIGANRSGFGRLLPDVDHLRHTHNAARPFRRGQPKEGADLADDLLRLVALHGTDRVAAVIVEPMAGSTGVLPPPKGYLERLRQLTAGHGILLIFDEIITGFGRTGAMTTAERLGVEPDMIVLAKGISNGTVPLGAVAVSNRIHEDIMERSPVGIELFHGYTSSGHPLAMAAAMATMDIFGNEDLCRRALDLEPAWQTAVHGLRGARHVIDIRDFGIAAGIELASRPDEAGARGEDLLQRCFTAGVVVRVTGDTIALAPPLIIDIADVHRVIGVIADALAQID